MNGSLSYRTEKIKNLWVILCQGSQPRVGSDQLPDGRLRVLRQDSLYGLVTAGTHPARLINGSVIYEAESKHAVLFLRL